MRVRLAYGGDGLEVDLPDERTTVITPVHPPAVKGMSAAHQVVRMGGVVICAVECRDGFPVRTSSPPKTSGLRRFAGR